MSKEVGDGKIEKRKKSTKVKGKKLSTDTDRSDDVDETDEVTHACRLTVENSFAWHYKYCILASNPWQFG